MQYLERVATRKAIVSTAGRLMAFRTVSQTGDHVEQAQLRAAMGYLTEEVFAAHEGIRVEVFELPSGPVLVADVGPASARRITWLGHLDVVAEDERARCELEIRGKWLYGRGAADMKAAVSCAAHAMLWLAEHERLAAGLRLPEEARIAVRFILTGDAESGGASFREYVRGAGGDSFGEFVIALEPTLQGRISLQSKGHLAIGYRVVGRSAHSAYPHLAISAIEINRRFQNAAHELRLPSVNNPWYTDGVTLEFTMFSAGAARNMIPGLGEGTISIRYPAPLDHHDILPLIGHALSVPTIG